MTGTIEARVGFSRRDGGPGSADDVTVPGYPDNRIVLQGCAIRDARRADASLDREGFTLVRHETAFAGERDRKVLAKDYQAEVAAFLQDHLNAAKVVPSPGGLLVRYGARLVGRCAFERPTDIIDDRIPASFAHVDYLPGAVPGQDAAHGRMMIVQTWRAVSPPPQDVPLAICDRRSLDERDIAPIKGILAPENAEGAPTPVFHVGGVRFNPDQRWFYYPSMRADELLVFTGFDTARPDAWKVAHAAFDNRHTDPGAQPRESIEARFYAYFD